MAWKADAGRAIIRNQQIRNYSQNDVVKEATSENDEA